MKIILAIVAAWVILGLMAPWLERIAMRRSETPHGQRILTRAYYGIRDRLAAKRIAGEE